MNERNSNFEALRILAMLAIVAGHFFPAITSYTSPCDVAFSHFMSTGVRMAVNIFVMIGAWFMVDYEFKFRRILRLYVDALFYSLAALAVAFVFHGGAGIVDIVRGIEPFFGVRYWFVTVYIMLIALAPFLKLFFRLPRSTQLFALIAIGGFTCIFSSYPYPRVGSMERFLGWFMYLFILIGYIKQSMLLQDTSKRKVAIFAGGGVLLYIILVAMRCIENGHGIAFQYTYDVASIPNFLCSLLIFLAVANLKAHSSRWVNLLAKNTFGVYLIHGELIAHFSGKQVSPAYATLVILGIYLFCTIIDAIQKATFWPLLNKLRVLSRLCNRVDVIMSRLMAR